MYKYIMISFGLTNAPAYVMEHVEHGVYRVTVLIDDVLVYPKDKEGHKEHICLMLQKLQDHGLYVKLSECEFWIKQVFLLSHVILE
jgi:hypothetical protein